MISAAQLLWFFLNSIIIYAPFGAASVYGQTVAARGTTTEDEQPEEDADAMQEGNYKKNKMIKKTAMRHLPQITMFA